MGFDFAAFGQMADNMIGGNGRQLKLVKADATERTFTGWEADYSPGQIDGQLILENDKRLRAIISGLAPDPETERVRFPADGEGEPAGDWRIVNVRRRKKPDGSVMFYLLQVRSL